LSRFLKILAGLLLLLLALLLLPLLLLDPNDFKDEIQDSVFRATGRQLTIEGDLSLTLLPRLGLEVSGASVANPPGFGDEPFAKLERVEMDAPLLPLLAGRLEVERVRIEGLRLNLIRDPQGRTNWDLTPPPAKAAEAAVVPSSALERRMPAFVRVSAEEAVQAPAARARPPSAPLATQDKGGKLVSLTSIAGVDLVDAHVLWDDRKTGWSLVLEGLEADSGPIRRGEPVTLQLSSGLTDAHGRFNGKLAGETTVVPDGATGGFVLEPLKLRLESLRTANGLEAWGALSGRLIGNPRARRYQVDGLGVQFDVAGAALAGGHLNGNLSTRLDLDLGAGTLAIDGFSLRSGTLTATGDALGSGLRADPVYEGHLAVAEVDLRAWLQQHGLPQPRAADPEALRLVSLTSEWRLDRDRLDLTNLVITLDQSHFEGTANMVDGEPRAFAFDLAADTLELDRYLPGSPASSALKRDTRQRALAGRPTVSSQTPTGWRLRTAAYQPPPAPVAQTAATRTPPPSPPWYLEGRLSISDLTAARLTFGGVRLLIRFEDRELEVDSRVERFYHGQLSGFAGLDLRGDEPKITLVQDGVGIEIGPLLWNVARENRLTGRGDITADLTAWGRDEAAIRRSLTGTLTAHMTAGAVKGFNLERMVRETEARLRGKPFSSDLPNQTDFSDLRATGLIEGGMLSNEDLNVVSDYVRITGKGRVDLANEQFDYRFEPMFVDPPKGRGIKELENIPIPVLLTGTFDQPKWQVDVADAVRGIARRKLEEKGGDLLKKLEERTGIKGLEQGLRGLLGR